uniref:Endonuclease/exonuclease/phosphatase domain-containing protein n=1 Tax=Rhizophagus irregularis (strain DAOM 181602 / DAOM 197198 / MUCL 43194) TaxID=747089 RepID=U9SWI5_RHIID
MHLILQHFNLINLADKFGLSTAPTHIPSDSNKQLSVIDYIFGSKNLCNKTLNFKILNMVDDEFNDYNSDHNLLMVSIDHPNEYIRVHSNNNYSKLRASSSNDNDHYNIKDLNTDQWNRFQMLLNNCAYPIYEESDRIGDPQQFINLRMNQIDRDIKEALAKNDILERLRLIESNIKIMTKLNFDNNDIIEETLSHKVLGYLDDTTWLAENIEDLENNLMIANNFYELANIHINKDKSFILVNRYARKSSSRIIAANPPYIDINFRSKIKVPVLNRNQSTRILGVYFNADDGRQTKRKNLHMIT